MLARIAKPCLRACGRKRSHPVGVAYLSSPMILNTQVYSPQCVLYWEISVKLAINQMTLAFGLAVTDDDVASRQVFLANKTPNKGKPFDQN
jgi:hypothetical protein